MLDLKLDDKCEYTQSLYSDRRVSAETIIEIMETMDWSCEFTLSLTSIVIEDKR